MPTKTSGRQYVPNVCEEILISPGNFAILNGKTMAEVGFEEEVDTENIPPAASKPTFQRLAIDDEEPGNLVIFDIETTCTGK